MKIVILAGGFGTRIAEESHLRPKPMVEIGEQPILWHIMKIYSYYGFNEFIICCGYKQHMIKEYFADYYLYRSDITYDFSQANRVTVHHKEVEPWIVTLVDTGLNTMTGGRIKRIEKYIDEDNFMLTYGDGVAKINLKELEAFHYSHNKIATISAVNVAQRFGVLDIDDENNISAFREKDAIDGGMINGGFMIFKRSVFEYIDGDDTIFERGPMEALARDKELKAYKITGFWQCMDTTRDKEHLESLWQNGAAPWKVW